VPASAGMVEIQAVEQIRDRATIGATLRLSTFALKAANGTWIASPTEFRMFPMDTMPIGHVRFGDVGFKF
jgi:hypothetical protein